MGRIVMAFAALALAGVALNAHAQTPTPKQLKAARKLLGKVKLVDGAGSGLDADTLQGQGPSAFLPAAAASGFLGVGAKAADADTLDGIDSSEFVKKTDAAVKHFSCSGTASFPIDNGEGYSTAGSERYATGGFALFRCSVVVPDGATVTAASCTVKDQDASNGTYCEMWRTNAATGVESPMADMGSTSSAATPGVTQLTTSTITNGTIDNAGFSYFVQSGISGTNSNVGLYGFNLTYSITAAGTAAPISAGAPAAPSHSSTD